MRFYRKQGLQLWAMLVMSHSMFSCTLSSTLGFNDEGLPVKEVAGTMGSAEQPLIDHTPWDNLLKKYVREDGLVDYKGFLNDRIKLKSYLEMLSKNPPKEDWSTAELLAYYINTYNAYTIDLILENYPVKSIKDINGPWTKAIVPIGDKWLSLGGLENSILRKMNEPRIHFAINCASYSCPDLLNEAYTADKIESQLDKVTKSFINGNKNKITADQVSLSKIFSWYKKDFEVNGKKDVAGYINNYSKVKISEGAKIDYLEYNWDLNKLK